MPDTPDPAAPALSPQTRTPTAYERYLPWKRWVEAAYWIAGTVMSAVGNTITDAEAFFGAGIEPADHRVMYLFEDPDFGSRTIPSYTSLLPELGGLPLVCD